MLEGCTNWPEEYHRKYLKAGFWQRKPLGDILDDAIQRYGDHVAIVFNHEDITYADLGRRVDRLALHLLDMGHKPLDRMLLHMPNLPETIYLYFAAVKIGVIPIMVVPQHRLYEIGFFAELARVTSYAIPGTYRNFDYTGLAHEVRPKNPSLKHFIVNQDNLSEGMTSLKKLLNDPIEERVDANRVLASARPDPFEPAVFQLSGGTTGIPKLIPRTHNDYYYNSLVCQRYCGFDKNTVYLISLPITHNYSTSSPGFQGVFMSGGKVVLAPSSAPDVILPLIERERVTMMPAVPTVVINMMSHPDLKRYDLSSLKVMTIGGSKLNPELAREVRPRLGADVQQGYGMAEGPLLLTRLDDPEEIRFYCQGGLLSPGDEFKIMDPDNAKEVSPGDVGELWWRGPTTIRGYYKAPERNAVAFTEDGFYKTGDLFRVHPSGNLVVEGRIKDTINRGGVKISAEEMENHILAYSKVNNCAYVAMPDPVLGEKACVFVIPMAGQTFELNELNDFLVKEREVAKFKLPERLEIVTELPLSNVGKVSKVRLREMIMQKLKKEEAI